MRIGISQSGQNSVGMVVTSGVSTLLADHLRCGVNTLGSTDHSYS
jgi:hypothetical protein